MADLAGVCRHWFPGNVRTGRVEIGIFGKAAGGRPDEDNPLYLAKYPVRDGGSTITLVVDGEPYQAGIDPFNVLIDRISDDNRTRVTMAAEDAPADLCPSPCQASPRRSGR